MEQKVVEEAVISSLLLPENFAKLRRQEVSEDSFTYYPHVYRFIVDFYREYSGKLPAKELVQQKFQFPFVEAEDFDYYVKELKSKELGRKAEVVLEQGINLLSAEEAPDEAVNYLLRELVKLRRRKQLTSSLTDGEALKRLDGYLMRRDAVGKGLSIGLRTGLTFFDEEGLGLKPGNLFGIVGNTTVGKSWLLEYIAITSYIENKARVLFISPEMTIEEVEERWDTLAGRFFGVEISNFGLATGRGVNVERYTAFLKEIEKRRDWITYEASDEGKAFTLPVIEDLADQFKPDVLAIDGLPLLGLGESRRRGMAQWEELGLVTYGVKNLAKANSLVVLMTNQAVRGAEGKEEPGLKDSALSYDFVRACDQAVMISTKTGRDDIRLVRLMKRRVGKQGLKPVEISWDVDRGIIGGEKRDDSASYN